MVKWVVKFSRREYKIRFIFGQKSTYPKLQLYFWTYLKVSKSQIYAVLTSPKKWTKVTILSIKDAQDSDFRSFFGRIVDTIICFWGLLTFTQRILSYGRAMCYFSMPAQHQRVCRLSKKSHGRPLHTATSEKTPNGWTLNRHSDKPSKFEHHFTKNVNNWKFFIKNPDVSWHWKLETRQPIKP
jgi:hypothetical protein